MCRNYRLEFLELAREKSREKVRAWFPPLTDSDWENPEPRKSGNGQLYPGYEGLVVHAGSRVVAMYRWGMDNFVDPKQPLVNARSDKLLTSSRWKKAFATTRCLVPADGWYEHRQSDPYGSKRRYLMTAGEGTFAIAGLWEERLGIRSYTIVMTDPTAESAEIHDRMPCVLMKDEYERWLDPNAKPEDLMGLLRPWEGKLTIVESPKPSKPKAEKLAKETNAEKPAKAPRAKKGAKADEGGGLFG
jgi:putative SOS response-associated peptidase YedK